MISDVLPCLYNQDKISLFWYVARWVHCDDRNEPKAELYARVAQLVEHLTCMQGVVALGSFQSSQWTHRATDM